MNRPTPERKITGGKDPPVAMLEGAFPNIQIEGD